MTSKRRLVNPDRLEGVALVVILLAVGGMAGAASFTHVKDWTMLHAPTGTGDWFGWSNAVISELTPAAALLVIRRRRRIDPRASIGYPLALIVAAVALSLSAQVAVANDSFSSRLLSSVPALAFLALSKLVLTGPVKSAAASPREAAPASEPVEQAAEDVQSDLIPLVVPEPPAPSAPVAIRSGLVSSVVQQPGRVNGHSYPSEVIR